MIQDPLKPGQFPQIPNGAWDCHTHVFGPWVQFPLPAEAAYRPAEAPFESLKALHGRLGITNGVLVQAAAYGSDHTALVAALRASAGRYRGIALIEPDVDQITLGQLHEAGVRGARLNVVPHLPGGTDPGRMKAIAARIRTHGWHLLVHGKLNEVLLALRALENSDIPVVIDHMARVEAELGVDYSEFAELEESLARPDRWIKVSGADRISRGVPPFDDAAPIIRRLLQVAPTRTLWGSDWPHPNITTPWPDEAALLLLLEAICEGRDHFVRVLTENPLALYR
ncbi:amidohydrolase [Burkholderia sp. L27(2015)]|uniref:amidohydrolase family protein n=1 Tax=Burkholderia sp. L27(2015) TaxID=1641858 RepID=UPI00265CE8EF|nr:amidohydrolase family protein [Burkholderia sp. L27(2015)]